MSIVVRAEVMSQDVAFEFPRVISRRVVMRSAPRVTLLARRSTRRRRRDRGSSIGRPEESSWPRTRCDAIKSVAKLFGKRPDQPGRVASFAEKALPRGVRQRVPLRLTGAAAEPRRSGLPPRAVGHGRRGARRGEHNLAVLGPIVRCSKPSSAATPVTTATKLNDKFDNTHIIRKRQGCGRPHDVRVAVGGPRLAVWTVESWISTW
jgi:hypothetical protein